MKFGLVSDFFLFFKNALYEVARGLQLSFNIFRQLNLAYNKNKLYKTLDYRSRDMLNFDFLKKDLGIVHDF